MDNLVIIDGAIKNIDYREWSPVKVSGYKNIELHSLNVFGLIVGGGFDL